MSKLGHQMFALSPRKLLTFTKKRFASTMVGIFRKDPDLTDLQAANELMASLSLQPLTIHDPTTTLLSWSTEPVRVPGGVAGHAYLHEAQVPYDGSADLWRLVCSQHHSFATRVTVGVSAAKLRAFRLDRDVEQFREDVSNDLGRARLATTQQGPAIDLFHTYLHSAIDCLYGHHDFGGLRDHANTLNKQTWRLATN